MKDFLIGFILFFTSVSCIQFWGWFIHLEKTKQVDLIDLIFKKKGV